MKKEEYFLVVLRIFMGWIFLWAFIDKLFGFGFATVADKSWILGNSPTYGFLSAGTSGPFASVFQSMAGNVFVDWLFMLGLLLIGISLILGIARKISCYAGVLMMLLMWLATLLPSNNPLIDDHIIYALVLIILANVETRFSLAKWWKSLSLVKKSRWLR